jgi:hypothetical protein
MSQWEYHLLMVGTGKPGDRLLDPPLFDLNRFGREGWEAVGIASTSSMGSTQGLWVLFKRPLEGSPSVG